MNCFSRCMASSIGLAARAESLTLTIGMSGPGDQKPDGSTPPEKPEGENTPYNGSDAKA